MLLRSREDWRMLNLESRVQRRIGRRFATSKREYLRDSLLSLHLAAIHTGFTLPCLACSNAHLFVCWGHYCCSKTNFFFLKNVFYEIRISNFFSATISPLKIKILHLKIRKTVFYAILYKGEHFYKCYFENL